MSSVTLLIVALHFSEFLATVLKLRCHVSVNLLIFAKIAEYFMLCNIYLLKYFCTV